MLIIKNGLIHDAIHKDAYKADIAVENGKIAAIGDVTASKDAEVLDAAGMDVWPGLIDTHSHLGLFGYGGPASKDDDELTKPCYPQNRGIDAINPLSRDFRAALRGGVTTIGDGPGSVECIGGTHLVIKTYGKRIDKMVLKNPSAVKIAFGENPKTASLDKKTTRMTIASHIRDTLYAAKEYGEKRKAGTAAYNSGYEALLPVLRKEIPLKAHAHRLDDIFTAIRIAKEFDVLLTLEHCTEGGLAAEEIAAEGYPVCVGPFFGASHKEENIHKHPSLAVKLIEAGCHVCVMTDFPVIGEEYLAASAGLLVREGLDEFTALKTVTVNAAEHLGVADRVGTLEQGKDADIVLTRGSILNLFVKPEIVFQDGVRLPL